MDERRPCPFCAEMILPGALLCRFCGSHLDLPPVPLTPARRRAGLLDLLFAVLILWGLEFAVGLAIAATQGKKALQMEMSPALILAVSAFSFASTLAVSWLFVCRKYRLGFREGFSLKGPGLPWALVSVGSGVVLAVIGIVLISLWGTKESMMTKLIEQPGGLATVCVMALLAPFFEEIYYRGFIFPVFEKKWGGAAAIIVSTLWFTAAHVMQFWKDPIGIVVILALSIVLAVQRRMSGSLTAPILTHGAYNGVLVVTSLIGKALTE